MTADFMMCGDCGGDLLKIGIEECERVLVKNFYNFRNNGFYIDDSVKIERKRHTESFCADCGIALNDKQQDFFIEKST